MKVVLTRGPARVLLGYFWKWVLKIRSRCRKRMIKIDGIALHQIQLASYDRYSSGVYLRVIVDREVDRVGLLIINTRERKTY